MRAEACKTSGGSGSELVQYHFCLILLTKTSHKASLARFKEWRNRPYLLIGEAAKSHSNGRGHKGCVCVCARTRACARMEDFGLSSLGRKL